ncbi:MAG: M56 family metallopeptidase, partial [Bacteroidota bacterium]
MLPYLPHAALLIAIALVFYKALLERETFFNLNRWLLVACLLLAFLIPTVEIPADWSIWPAQNSTSLTAETDLGATAIPDLVVPSQSETISAADLETEKVLSEEAISELATAVETSKVPFYKTLDWKQILWFTYLVGVFIFGINLLIQFFALLFQIIRHPSIKDGKFRIIELEADKAPYSFLNCIFINPTKYDWETYDQIIKHEKIHIAQAHSIDMILAELLVVVQWFNPAAWYYRKAIENNLEYLTDSAMLHKGAEAEPYQMNLLKVSVPHYPIGLAMNYNQSILKKRIKMMNAKKSSVRTSWKYLAIMPILGLSIICFNAVKVVANQQNPTTLEIPQPTVEAPEVEVNGLAEIINDAIQLSTQVVEDVVQGEIEQVVADLESIEQTFSGAAPAEMKGVWQAEIDGNQVCVRFDNSDLKRNSYWISTECFGKSEFSGLPTTEKEFTLERAAGKVIFTGKFDGDEGLGRYRFEPKASFANFLKQEGVRGDAKEETMFHFFLADMDQQFVKGLKSAGYKDLQMNELKKLAIHDVDEKYIKEMAQLGYDDLSLRDLVKGKIHDVDPAYIKELKETGFDNLDFDDLVKFS